MSKLIKVLSLFSGGGLGDYGLELAGMQIVGQVEINDYCQNILKLRWPNVPKWKDIKEFKGSEVERVDLVSGGFPCQPFSVAGKRKGNEDERDLWGEMFRVIRQVKPRWVLAENVGGLLSISNGRQFGKVVRDLASVGYGVEWDCIPASAIGAPHRRDRIWVLAHTKFGSGRVFSGTLEKEAAMVQRRQEQIQSRSAVGNCGPDVAHAKGTKQQRVGGTAWEWRGESGCSRWWATEPNVGRVAHGVAKRVDRLKLLGNGQVVQVVEWIGKKIIEFEQINRI